MLDYYTDEPGKSNIGDQLQKCGTSIGVAKVDHQSVPGPTLIQKVLQQASSKTLPDVLMLDNPDIQQIAEAGALAPLGDFGINADGYAPGPVSAATYDGQLYGLQPGANTLAIFYNKDVLAKAGVQPPKTWDELKATAKKLTSGKQYGFAFNATADYEGAWQFLPPMWTNGGDETDLKSPQVAEALQLWKDLVDDGSVSKSVGQLEAVRRQRPVHRRQGGHDGERSVADPRADEGEDQLRRCPVPGQQARPDVGRPARWRGVDRAGDRQRGEEGQGRRAGQVHEHRREPDAAGQAGRPGADQARAGRRSSRRKFRRWPASPTRSPAPAPGPASSARSGPTPPR